ncbi:MAG: hypothetical protein U0869_12325 [Chloroflexota bacterium]
MSGVRGGRWVARGLVVLALPVAFWACTSGAAHVPIDPGTPAPPGPIQVDPASTPPPGPYLAIDSARLSPDGRTLSLTYTGGPEGDPLDPCNTDSSAWAHAAGDALVAAAFAVDHGTSAAHEAADALYGEHWGCTLIGHLHTRQVVLPEPFHGALVRDLAGGGEFVARPDGLVELGPLPEGWVAGPETGVRNERTPLWRRTWEHAASNGSRRRPGTIALFQAFDAPAAVGGGDEVRTVTVDGKPARLSREPETGELVLTWRLGTDGLALVADEQDLPPDALIQLAESARAPGG